VYEVLANRRLAERFRAVKQANTTMVGERYLQGFVRRSL
jgi:hypothetical protein